ncbi:unknown [Prevotella sp. CAG:873]|nr:unknown [Prevotella sp. CAG:873]
MDNILLAQAAVGQRCGTSRSRAQAPPYALYRARPALAVTATLIDTERGSTHRANHATEIRPAQLLRPMGRQRQTTSRRLETIRRRTRHLALARRKTYHGIRQGSHDRRPRPLRRFCSPDRQSSRNFRQQSKPASPTRSDILAFQPKGQSHRPVPKAAQTKRLTLLPLGRTCRPRRRRRHSIGSDMHGPKHQNQGGLSRQDSHLSGRTIVRPKRICSRCRTIGTGTPMLRASRMAHSTNNSQSLGSHSGRNCRSRRTRLHTPTCRRGQHLSI